MAGQKNNISYWNGLEGRITGRDVQSGIGAQANSTVTYIVREPDGKDMQFSLGFTVRRYRDAGELNSRVLTGGRHPQLARCLWQQCCQCAAT